MMSSRAVAKPMRRKPKNRYAQEMQDWMKLQHFKLDDDEFVENEETQRSAKELNILQNGEHCIVKMVYGNGERIKIVFVRVREFQTLVVKKHTNTTLNERYTIANANYSIEAAKFLEKYYTESTQKIENISITMDDFPWKLFLLSPFQDAYNYYLSSKYYDDIFKVLILINRKARISIVSMQSIPRHYIQRKDFLRLKDITIDSNVQMSDRDFLYSSANRLILTLCTISAEAINQKIDRWIRGNVTFREFKICRNGHEMANIIRGLEVQRIPADPDDVKKDVVKMWVIRRHGKRAMLEISWKYVHFHVDK